MNIVWFKRDLRIEDHQPLFDAARAGPVLPLYIIEPDLWRQPDASGRHWYFIRDSLLELRAALAALGQSLVVRVGAAVEVLESLRQHHPITALYSHEETGNGWSFARDLAVGRWCRAHGIPWHETPSGGVVRRLVDRDAWSQIRNQRMAAPLVPVPNALDPVLGIDPGTIPARDDRLFPPDTIKIVQPGGRKAGLVCLDSFLSRRGQRYLQTLSRPGISARHCMRVSPHISFGTLSVREVVQAVTARLARAEDTSWARSLQAAEARLAWHCHFIQKLESDPAIEHKCMHLGYEGMRPAVFDADAEARFQAWAQGRTGFPLVDACMRSLHENGWITFRMRAMLVSFSSYHLGLHWQRPAWHLARLFTDYEPGIHYPQIQMQSGTTGINIPRIYNVVKQSAEQDPDGRFIRRFVPELASVPISWIHQPWMMPPLMQHESGMVTGTHYPAPIIDHVAAARAAKAMITAVRHQPAFKDQAEDVRQRLASRKRDFRRTGDRAPKAPAAVQLDLF